MGPDGFKGINFQILNFHSYQPVTRINIKVRALYSFLLSYTLHFLQYIL